jgi:hypothetical protein
VLVIAICAAVVAAGAGGRLAMRLLAVTSPDAQGAITEAEARIGEITAGGTLGFVIFVGLPAGVLIAVLYALAGPLVRGGRLGGAALGAILLVLIGTNEPLRSENPDFNPVGPDWLSILCFVALALALTVAIAARPTRSVTSRRPGPRVLLIGRVALAVVVLAALPFLATNVTDILSS